MKPITQRDGSILAACRREISLHVRKPLSKKIYKRTAKHHTSQLVLISMK